MSADSVLSRIEGLIEEGDSYLNHDDFAQALTKYHEAAALLPELKEDFDVSLQLYTAIGEAHFFAGEHDQALRAFQTAMKSPGGLENPLAHLRLGQAYFELGIFEKSADELARAYMLDGPDVFEGEDEKYLSFLAARMKL